MVHRWIIAVTAGLLSVGAQAQVTVRSARLPKIPGCEGESRHRFDLVLDNGLGKTATGTTFQVKPLTIIDSGKDKPGKKITAVVIEQAVPVENTIVRHNAKVIGHIEEMQKLDKTHPEARLRLVFDQIKLKHGRTLAFAGVVHEIGAESILNTEYWEPSPYDPLGRWVHIDDWPDAAELGQYCYIEDFGQGIVITSKKSNIHLRFHAVLTLRVVPSQSVSVTDHQEQAPGHVDSSVRPRTDHSSPP